MSSEQQLAGRKLVISGGSRGIGLAIGLGAAKLGANVVLLAKTSEPHLKLPVTVHTAVADVESAGGKGLAVVGDVRKDEDVQRAVDAAVDHFGGVDVVINNASAIATDPTYVDAEVPAGAGITDLSRYGGGDEPRWDIFVDKS